LQEEAAHDRPDPSDLSKSARAAILDAAKRRIDTGFERRRKGFDKQGTPDSAAGEEKPTALRKWAESMPWAELVADAISVKDPSDPIPELCQLEAWQVAAISDAIRDGVERMLMENVEILKEGRRVAAEREAAEAGPAGAKFQVFAMSAGRVEDFHRGLEDRVGERWLISGCSEFSLLVRFYTFILLVRFYTHFTSEVLYSYAGPPHLKFLKAMNQEHSVLPGHDLVFTTTNYHIETCPRVEWRLLEIRRGVAWDTFIEAARIELPQVELSRDRDGHERYIPDVEELLLLGSSVSAQLTLEEVIAVVLYTGPMVSLSPCVILRVGAL
jgi:hypothetical protein